jgi:hypothetical protein
MNYFEWKYQFEYDTDKNQEELIYNFKNKIDGKPDIAKPLEESFEKLSYRQISESTFRLNVAKWLREMHFSLLPPRPRITFIFTDGRISVRLINIGLISRYLSVSSIAIIDVLFFLKSGSFGPALLICIVIIIGIVITFIRNFKSTLDIIEKLAIDLQ